MTTVTSNAMGQGDLVQTAYLMFSVPRGEAFTAACLARENGGSHDINANLTVLWRQDGTSEVYYLVYKTGEAAR